MFDLNTATKSVERDLDAILDRFDQLDDDQWTRPMRCTNWTVHDLSRHLLAACRGQAEGLRRAAADRLELAELAPPPETDAPAVVAALRSGRDELLLALRTLPESVLAGVVPLPFGLLPAPVALQIVPLEYGFHRNDLDWALGDETPLGDDISASLLGIAPGLLPILAGGTPVSRAGERPPSPITFELSAPSLTITAAFDAAKWTIAPGPADGPDACRVSGDDSAIALFIMGRIDPADPRLAVTGDAQRFKAYFPGP